MTCAASEVHAMVECSILHGTDPTVEATYVEVARLRLLPRITRINRVKLYRADALLLV